jgi:hypothetical protein
MASPRRLLARIHFHRAILCACPPATSASAMATEPPNEYYVIKSANPKIQGIAGAIRAQVDYLYKLAL